jgi:hypothetical protein
MNKIAFLKHYKGLTQSLKLHFFKYFFIAALHQIIFVFYKDAMLHFFKFNTCNCREGGGGIEPMVGALV